MDMMLELFNITDKKLDEHIDAINKSDLVKETKWDLIDLLRIVRLQTNQARAMGWLPRGF